MNSELSMIDGEVIDIAKDGNLYAISVKTKGACKKLFASTEKVKKGDKGKFYFFAKFKAGKTIDFLDKVEKKSLPKIVLPDNEEEVEQTVSSEGTVDVGDIDFFESEFESEFDKTSNVEVSKEEEVNEDVINTLETPKPSNVEEPKKTRKTKSTVKASKEISKEDSIFDYFSNEDYRKVAEELVNEPSAEVKAIAKIAYGLAEDCNLDRDRLLLKALLTDVDNSSIEEQIINVAKTARNNILAILEK